MSMEPVGDLATIERHDMSLLRIILEWTAGWCTLDIDGPVVPGPFGARLRWLKRVGRIAQVSALAGRAPPGALPTTPYC